MKARERKGGKNSLGRGTCRNFDFIYLDGVDTHVGEQKY